MKLKFLLILLNSFLLIKCAEKQIQPFESFSDSEMLSDSENTFIKLISSDMDDFQIEPQIAFQSKYIKTEINELQNDLNIALKNEIYIDIDSILLEKIMDALTILYNNKSKLSLCLLFELIQKNVWDKIPNDKTNEIIKALELLDCEILTNSFLDIYSQILIEIPEISLSLILGFNKLQTNEEKRIEYLAVIAKFYYLRKNSNFPTIDFKLNDYNIRIHAKIFISELDKYNFNSHKYKTVYTFK